MHLIYYSLLRIRARFKNAGDCGKERKKRTETIGMPGLTVSPPLRQTAQSVSVVVPSSNPLCPAWTFLSNRTKNRILFLSSSSSCSKIINEWLLVSVGDAVATRHKWYPIGTTRESMPSLDQSYFYWSLCCHH